MVSVTVKEVIVLRIAVVISAIVLCAACNAQTLFGPQASLQANGVQASTAPAPDDAPAEVAGKAIWRCTVQNAGGQEHSPGVTQAFPTKGPNLSGYTTLAFWVRVTSSDAAVTSKDLSLVLYSRGSDKQQFTRHSVPVGQWALLRDDIAAYSRGDVSQAVLCLYETQTERHDTYTWEIGPVMLQRLARLDAGWMQASSPAQGGAGETVVAKTDDGLGLYARPGAASVSLDGSLLHARADLPSGLLVRDVAADGLWLPASEGGRIGLKVDFSLAREGKAVRLAGTVHDTTGKDRAISVAFAIPVPKDNLTWWQDVREKRPAAAEPECGNFRWDGAGARGLHSFYPLAVVTRDAGEAARERVGQAPRLPGGTALAGETPAPHGIAPRGPGFGLALATRLDEPTVSRLIYDGVAERLAVVYDFGLAPDCRKYPSQAPFSFTLRRCDPATGFRSATVQYAAMYPRFFEKRPMTEGIWMPFTDIATVAAPEDFGFMFQEGAPNVAYDDGHGYYSFRYTEPMTWWMSMNKDLPRTYAAAMQELDRWQKQDKDSFDRQSARALPWCGIKDADGTYNHSFQNTSWCDGAVFALSPDPELPTDGPDTPNKGHMDYSAAYADKAYGVAPQAHRPAPAPGLDGEYLDSLEGWGTAQNYRRDHFAFADTPLTFSQQTKRPIILNWFSVDKFVRFIADDLHSRGRLLMANAVYAGHGWFAPYLDVAGIEVAWLDQQGQYRPDSDGTLAGYRWLSGKRPYLLLNNVDFYTFDQDMMQSYFKRALADGLYPSNFEGDAWDSRQQKWTSLRYWERPELYNRDRSLYVRFIPLVRQVATAGWEPLTCATCADAGIALERFGAYPDRLHITAFNSSEGLKRAEVRVDAKALGIPITGAGRPLVIDLVSGLDLPVRWERDALVATVALSPRNVAVIRIAPRGRIVADYAVRAAEALARHPAATGAGLGAQAVSVAGLTAALRQAAEQALAPEGPSPAWCDRLAALMLSIKGLRPPPPAPETPRAATDDARASEPVRLARDLGIASSSCTRAIMAARGIRLYATLIGSGTSSTNMQVRAAVVNGAATPISVALGFGDEGAPSTFGETHPIPAGQTLSSQIEMDVPAFLQIGKWVNRRLSCRLSIADTAFTTAAYIDLSPGRTLRTSIVAAPADTASVERHFTVTVENLSPRPIRGLASLVVPPGWSVAPESVMLEVPVGQKREVALAAIIPNAAPATMYSVSGYFAADEGTPTDRKSSPLDVFYFPPVEFAGTNVAAAAAGAKIAVDSSYEGYDAHPLNDGVVRPASTAHWTDAAWASQDSGEAHWIEITLPQPEEVSRLVVVWAYDNGNLYASQCCILQVERDGKWQDLGKLVSKTLPAYSVLDFEPTTADRFRLYQPASQGPASRPGIMWVTEVGLYKQ